MTKKELAHQIKATSLLKGHFILRSGQKATEYFDKYLFESSPTLLKAIVHHLKELIPPDTDLLAGLELGGVPLATALSLETKIPCVFVRKKAKEYGTKKITEGPSIKNKKVCVIEDVVTTGGQALLSTKDLRGEGALINPVLCVIHRGQDTLAFQQSALQLIPLFHYSQL